MIDLPITAASFEGDNSAGVPAHIRDGIARYINHGDPVGGFLTAFLNNDLRMALAAADDTNRVAMFEIARWFHNHAPHDCWGGAEKRQTWQARGGALGPREAAP